MWLRGFDIVLEDKVAKDASMRIENGIIAEIKETGCDAPSDHGAGMRIIPGLIDLHGDMIEREIEPRPGARFPLDLAVSELDKRLAACGITTAFVAVSFSEDVKRDGDLRSEEHALNIIKAVTEYRERASVDMRIHTRFEVSNKKAIPILKDMIETGQVHMVSLMDHTPGQGQYRDIEKYVRYVSKKYDLNEEDVLRDATKKVNARAAQDDPWKNAAAIAALAEEYGIPAASHDDDTVDKVQIMRGLRVGISEFPVSLDAAKAAKAAKLFTVMGAPNALRGRSNSGNLSAREALDAGVLDVLASDYHPASLLASIDKLTELGASDLVDAVALVSSAPAAAVNLEDRGVIALGKRADFCIVESAFPTRVCATFVEGKLVYSNGKLLEEFGLIRQVAA